MKFHVEKVVRKSGNRYRIVKDRIYHGQRKRTYKMLPEGTTKAQADKICNKMALEAEYGDLIEREPILFSEYVEDIYFPKYTNDLAVSTKYHYKQIYSAKDGIKKHLGDLLLTEVTTEILQTMVNYYCDRNIAPKTIRNYLCFISVVLDQAIKDKLLRRQERNATYFVREPKMVQKKGHTYSIEQVKFMLTKAQETENITIELIIALCCLSGGLRRSELAGLCWDDIVLNKEEAYVSVRRAIVRGEGGMAEKETKTQAGERIIPIQVNGIVYQILMKAKKLHMTKYQCTQGYQGKNHVFVLEKYPYSPMNPETLYKRFKKFLKEECPELPSYRLHDLRHTYFSLASHAGFNELSLIGTGGHSSLESSKRYRHPIMENVLKDMGKLEQEYNDAVVAVS